MIRLSAIISVRNGGREFERCLWSLARQRHELHELIIVDDGSRDETPANARAANCKVLRLPSQGGICRARNAGAATATGDVLAFIDADTIVLPGWGRALRNAFEGGATLVGGGIFLSPPSSAASRYRMGRDEHDQSGRNGFLPFAAGANVAIRRTAFESLGGFDESLPGAEDVDLSFRAQLAGYTISFVPGAGVIHPPRNTVPGMLRQHFRNSRHCRIVDFKYEEFPYQGVRRRDPLAVLAACAVRRVMVDPRADSAAPMPFIDSAMAVARLAGMRWADLELLAGLRPRPRWLAARGHEQRNTATPLPPGPVVLLLGEDRPLVRILQLALDAGPELSVAAPGLEREALECWNNPAPWSLRLAREARRIGWSVPVRMTALRLEREQPRTWAQAFVAAHGVRAWLHERPRFVIAAYGEAGFELAARFRGVPVVLAADSLSTAAGRVDRARIRLRLSRRDLRRGRRRMFAELLAVLDPGYGRLASFARRPELAQLSS